MSTLELWDGESDITGPILCFMDDEEWLRLWVLENKVQNTIKVFLVSENFRTELYSISNYICLKYDYVNSIKPNDEDILFFKTWKELISGNNINDEYVIEPPSLLYKSNTLIENMISAHELRLNILKETPWCNSKGVDFDHSWWKGIPKIAQDIQEFKNKIERFSTTSTVYKNLLKWIDSLTLAVDDLYKGTLESMLLSASAFFFSAAKFARIQGDINTSVLLIHRCIDVYFQYLGTSFRLVRESSERGEGLIYAGNDTRDVGFDRTKNKLIDGQHVYIDNELLKKVERINFIRNRSFLTHSFYGISNLEIDGYLSVGYTFVKTMEGDSGHWQRLVKCYLSKPDISEFDLYENEESFVQVENIC